MQKVTFDVQTRPTNDMVGVTLVNNVTFDSNGDVSDTVLMGSVTKARGVDTYSAALFTDEGEVELGSDFTSRSQAGHAIQRAFQADQRAAKAQARADKLAADAAARAEAKAAREAARAEKAAAREAEKAEKARARAEAKAAKEAAAAEKACARAEAAEGDSE